MLSFVLEKHPVFPNLSVYSTPTHPVKEKTWGIPKLTHLEIEPRFLLNIKHLTDIWSNAMLRNIVFSLFALILFCTPCFGQDWAKKMFKTTEHNFGSVAHDAKAEYRFVFDNIYLEDVHIANVYTSCSCTSVRVENPSVKTYEKGTIVAHFNTDSFRGNRGATITVVIDKPYPAEVQLHVRGNIRGDVSVEPGSVELGTIDQGDAVNWTVAIKHIGNSNWQILDAKSSNPHITADVVETGRSYGNVTYALKVHIDESTPAGYVNDHIILATNEGRGREIPVLVEGRIVPSISVSPASLFMGVVQPGQKVTKQLVVRGKTPFRILSVTCEDDSFRFNNTADQQAKQLHLIPVTFHAGQDAGQVIKKIRIKTDQGEMTPELTAYAIVAEQDKAQTPQ